MIIDVVEADVRTAPVDVLVLKFAEMHRGADLAVALALDRGALEVPVGQHRFVASNGRVEAKEILVLGVGPLSDFEYGAISKFAWKSLTTIANERPSVRHIGVTIHGPGYGLDELASIASLVEGLVMALAADRSVDGLGSGDFRVSIIESSSRRARRIREYLASASLNGAVGRRPLETRSPTAEAISNGGRYNRRLFAALPFKDEFLDHWELALQPAAHENRFVIERLDHEHFTGDIVAEIRTRIERSTGVVALLDDHNPNVFLEVGYAWGVKKPALLLLREGVDPPFDVRGQRLIRYQRIAQMKTLLSAELRSIFNAA
jgi:hypothetical protein